MCTCDEGRSAAFTSLLAASALVILLVWYLSREMDGGGKCALCGGGGASPVMLHVGRHAIELPVCYSCLEKIARPILEERVSRELEQE